MDFDCLVKGGTIVDGTGAAAFSGSVGIKEGKITAVLRSTGDVEAAEKVSGAVIDAAGLTVTPGFIDMHSHADWVLPLPEHPSILAPLLEQGVTTVVGGNCGFSPAPLKEGSEHLDLISAAADFVGERPLSLEWGSMHAFLADLDRSGLALNLAMLAGHGNLRFSMFGSDYSYPGEEALREMEDLAEKALDEGACGISLGLGYAPGLFSELRELEKFARIACERDRLLTVHLKAYTRLSGAYPLKLTGNRPHNLLALEEMLDLARRTGVKMQISHMLFVGSKTWPMADELLAMIDAAVEEGLDIAFDSFPYTCGNTTIYIAYPAWFLNNIEQHFHSAAARLRLRLEIAFIVRQLGFGLEDIQVLWGGHDELTQYEGLFFSEIAREMNCSVFEAYLKASELSKGKTLCLMHKYNGQEENEEVLHKVLCHPLNLFETDTILTSRGLRNPSSFGTFPRIIGHYQRDLNLLSLEEAIAKMTGRSALRFGLEGRGVIAEGNWADLSIFDYREIRDNTCLQALEERPSGIKYVLINGETAVLDGKAVPESRAGKVLRGG